MYKSISQNGYRFLFKYDYDATSKEYLPHIWIRHLVEPEMAIKAFFDLDEKTYNPEHQRYEGYSTKHDLSLFYFFIMKQKQSS